jgi:hydroxyethylthiazole kinase-like uncharacterized protein yjeF
MTELLTAAQMRAIEKAAIDSGDVTGLELMERAGRGVVEAIFEEWPEFAATPHRAVVLCGPGNNGGDGFVVARLLKQRGWEVEVFLYGDAENLPPDARVNYERWSKDEPVRPITDLLKRKTWATDLVVDALFGTGLTRPLEDLTTILFNIDDAADLNADPDTDVSKFSAPLVVAVDMPTGIHTDTGKVLVPSHKGQGAASANLTVTFHSEKVGHRTGDGPQYCGKVVVKDIGL